MADIQHVFFCLHSNNEKGAQRDANTARMLAVVRVGHHLRPPASLQTQTGPITIHCAAS